MRQRERIPSSGIPNADLRKNYLRWQSAIEFLAPHHALIVGGIIQRESAWEPNAERYESGFYDRYLKDNINWQRRIEEHGWQICHVASSWGLMQIMFVTAWERGYRGDPIALAVPETNLLYGTMHLAWLMERPKVTGIQDAVAAYNAGSPRLDDDGQYVNQPYVDYVFQTADQLKQIFARRTYGRNRSP